MQTRSPQLLFFTMLLLISFASVNAVLFTPALPDLAQFFGVSDNVAQKTILWFLIGYAFGQLVYGPIANRFGRKPALYVGVLIQIFSSFLCVMSGWIHYFNLMILGRFLLALGSGVGLKMTFTLVSECYSPKIASEKISYLMLAFAITPGLGVAIGGLLNAKFGWTSCFYAGAIYGVILLGLVTQLPETLKTRDVHALQLKHLLHTYGVQFKNFQLVGNGLLMGCGTSLVYTFSTLAPFIVINLLGLQSAEYGVANIIPAFGMLLGSLANARLTKRFSLQGLMRLGMVVVMVSALLLFIAIQFAFMPIASIFVLTMVVYFGASLIVPNASVIAMSDVQDKAHASAVMSFLNMCGATVVVLSLSLLQTSVSLLPSVYLCIGAVMLILLKTTGQSFPRSYTN